MARALTRKSLLPQDAAYRAAFSAGLVTATSLLSIGLNRLYEFQVSASRYERASRFVESAGIGIALSTALVIVSHLLGADLIYAFPGLGLSQKIQVLVATSAVGFVLLYLILCRLLWSLLDAHCDACSTNHQLIAYIILVFIVALM